VRIGLAMRRDICKNLTQIRNDKNGNPIEFWCPIIEETLGTFKKISPKHNQMATLPCKTLTLVVTMGVN
jgi:hypothetical protein